MKRLQGQKGIILIDIVGSMAILGLIGVVFMSGLSTMFRGQDIVKQSVQAENLMRAQLEDIRFQTYLDTYSVSVPTPSGYSLSIATQAYCTPEPCTPDNNIQKNTVTVFREGKQLLTMDDLKTRR